MEIRKASKKILLYLLILVVLGRVSWGGTMCTAFTYQGHLIDANDPAEGLYDFQFELYDSSDPCYANQIGDDVNIPDVDVTDGYFTV